MSNSNFAFKISIEAINQQEAITKLKAMTTLVKRLTTAELTRLAAIIEHDPEKTALAKKYLGV
jgi:hypothetical protein